MYACASVILPAARARAKEPDSVIAFHGTQYGLYTLYEMTKARDGHSFTQSPEVKVLGQQEYALYQDAGADPRLLLAPYTERGRLCYQEARQRDGSNRFAIRTEKPAYVVDAPTLAAFRINLQELQIERNGERAPELRPQDIERKFNSLSILACDAT
jgi:hypothetical protein